MEIDFATVGGLEKAEAALRIEFGDGSDGRFVMGFDLALQAANVILQLAARALEGVSDRKGWIGITFVVLRRAAHLHFAPFRKRKMDIDLQEPAGAVMPAGRPDRNTASRDAAEAAFKL